jgi:secreted PhoX family phosphatase
MADMDRRQFVSGSAAGLLIAGGKATTAAAADTTPTQGDEVGRSDRTDE